jgi:hypothetical protein
VAQASQLGLALSETLEFQFRRKYLLPPNDPRFLEMSPEDMLVDMWAHTYADNPKLREQDVSEGFDEAVAALEGGADLEEVINSTYESGV